jgi:hypothetical protein
MAAPVSVPPNVAGLNGRQPQVPVSLGGVLFEGFRGANYRDSLTSLTAAFLNLLSVASGLPSSNLSSTLRQFFRTA